MTLHPVIYTVATAQNGLTQIPAVAPDGVIPTDGAATPSYTVPKWARFLMGVYAVGANTARAQLRSATLRAMWGVNGMDIVPVRQLAIPLTGVAEPFPCLFERGIEMKDGESLSAFADNANNATRTSIVALLSDQPTWPAPDVRPYTTVRGTATTTMTALGWQSYAITFDDSLPDGVYDCVGMRFQGATMIASRVIPNRGASPNNLRNGFLASGNSQLVSFYSHNPSIYPAPRGGSWGTLFSAESKTFPSFEGFCVSADTAETVFVDLVKR